MKEIAPGIVVDSQIRSGRPVIKGTRVPVDVILGKLAGGMTIEEVMQEYNLTKQDVLNAISYAASVISEEEIVA